MAVSLGRRFDSFCLSHGTLAQTGLLGGTPREVVENVSEAEWMPAGSGLAVVRRVGSRDRLEYPVDHTLYETDGYISHPRFSHQGERIAFLDHPKIDDDRGWVSITDLAGHKTRLTEEYSGVEGLAWSPSGDELWFSAATAGVYALQGVTLAGRERLVWRGPGSVWLMDVAPDGRALVGETIIRGDIFALLPGESRERDLSWLSNSSAHDVSTDGTEVLFTNYDELSGPSLGVYLRKTDGSAAVHLGEGDAQGLSSDGKWALAIARHVPSALVLLPTGPGQARTLPKSGIEYQTAWWFPDGRRVLVVGNEAGPAARTYVQELDSGKVRPITPAGSLALALSPDGASVVAREGDGKAALYPVGGGEARPVPGLDEHDAIIRWAADGRTLFVTREGGTSAKIYRFDLATGRRALWRQVTVADPTGVSALHVRLTPDGKTCVYYTDRVLTDLYVVEGLK